MTLLWLCIGAEKLLTFTGGTCPSIYAIGFVDVQTAFA